MKEKQSVSIESSRTSFSSSCSSTFSSVDCNRTAKPEPSPLGHSIFNETPYQKLPQRQKNSSSHLGRESPDIRDVVKDSINRETRGLSVKTTTMAERTRHVVKHVDSPRPQQMPTFVKPKIHVLNESFGVLRSSKEEKSRALPLKDAPRFSYDGRESRDTWKSTIKVKELPRLSLDSREGSIRRSASEPRSIYLLEDLRQRNAKSNQILNSHQEPVSNKRPSSVVAKLMGLETFPDSLSANNDQIRKIKCQPDEDLDAMSTTSRKADESKHNQVSRSPRTPPNKAASLQLKNIDSIKKPNSGFPLEPAPWRQPDGNRGSQKPAFLYREAYTRAQNAYPSVYGEIKKRSMVFELKRSSEDLRALNQIFDTKQKTRESLEYKKEEQMSELEPETINYNPKYHNLDQNSTSVGERSQLSIHLRTPTIKEIGAQNFELANVVPKPRYLCSSTIPLEGMSGLHKLRTNDTAADKKDSVNKQTANDLTPRNNHFRETSCQLLCSMDKISNTKTYRSTQTSKTTPQKSGGNPTSSGRSSTTVSPRLQQKHGMEKQSRLTTQISGASRARRPLSKQQTESASPSRKFKPKSPNSLLGDDQLSGLSNETTQLSHQGDAISVQSESNISTASQTDIEVSSTDRSKETNGAYQKNKIEARLSEDGSKAETATATLEQPSPVSVLDTTFYREGSPSPVKKILNAFKDEESLSFDEEEWNSVDLEHFLNSTRPNLGPEFAREECENVKHLVHKFRQVNPINDEAATDYIRSLYENTNPEHRYITEILSASGLLKDLGSSLTFIQLSGHLINPKLFLVLEQTRGRIELPDDEHSNEQLDQSKFMEKSHRKLIFDTVDEILVRKIYSLGANPDCSLRDKYEGRLINILSEDMTLQTQYWADFHRAIPGIVMDIESLIFKDFIGEVVSGKAAYLPGRPTNHFRRLFPV
ncbi:longifolia [Sarracenia purpurea var. burkii]